MTLRTVSVSLVVVLALPGCQSRTALPPTADKPALAALPKDPPAGHAGATGEQLLDAVFHEVASNPWSPAVDTAKARGAALKVYSKVAPATVVVRTSHGHGSGFVIDAARGLVVTNNHVAVDGELDPQLGGLRVTVHFGRLNTDGTMKLVEPGARGVVLKRDSRKDLALIRLVDHPEGIGTRPALHVAEKVPLVGSDVVAIGHPAAALLWSARTCEISGIGTWPNDQIDVVIGMMAAADDEKAAIRRLLTSEPTRKIILTSCGLNPGDSGGSLVNPEGEVVGVSFGIPAADPDRNIGSDKFAYHVHLDELKEFLAEIPASPQNTPASPWPAARFAGLLDRDSNGHFETLVFFTGPKERSGWMVDLDENSTAKSVEEISASGERSTVWDWEVALTEVPFPSAFYDSDDDGKPDVVLIDPDGDGKADSILQLQGSEWILSPGGGKPLLDPTRLPPAMRERAAALFAE